MNNYNLSFAKTYSRAVAQQPHGHRENSTPCKRISRLDKYECQHGADSETAAHMLKVSMHAATQNSTTL